MFYQVADFYQGLATAVDSFVEALMTGLLEECIARDGASRRPDGHGPVSKRPLALRRIAPAIAGR